MFPICADTVVSQQNAKNEVRTVRTIAPGLSAEAMSNLAITVPGRYQNFASYGHNVAYEEWKQARRKKNASSGDRRPNWGDAGWV
jgi:hypothetical protein